MPPPPHVDASILQKIELREGDVFISTGPKQGTTWTCYIVQQLLSHGNNDFRHLHDVCSWPEWVYYPGQTVEERLEWMQNTSAMGPRRAIKTHLYPPILPLDSRVKYVVCVRNPLDAMASLFAFHNMFTDEFRALWNMPQKKSTWEEFIPFVANNDVYWGLVNSWWPHRFDKNVFMVHYSVLKNKPFEIIKRLAEFLGVDSSDEFVALGTERSSFENMKKSEEKFDQFLTGKNKDIPTHYLGAMMRKGKVAEGIKEVPSELADVVRQQGEVRCLDREQLEWCINGGELPTEHK